MVRPQRMSFKWTALLFVLATLLFEPSESVKHENFKRCDQSGFCKRNRALADKAIGLGSHWQSPYLVAPETLTWKDGQLQGTILKRVDSKGKTIRLPLTISFLESGVARVVVDEEARQKGDIELRHDSKARKERYNEVEKFSIVGGLEQSKSATEVRSEKSTTVTYGPDGRFEAVITFAPFGIEFKRDTATEVKFNDRGLFNVDHWRAKIEKVESEKKEGDEAVATPDVPEEEDEGTWWDESFGGNTDTKPRGPESLSIDITFPGYEHVFGIPEHAGPLSLKETKQSSGNYEDPYRLYNADVFEYITDSPMTLYGAIPFMQAHKKDSTVGVFWMNAAEMWIDVAKQKEAHNPLSLGIGSKIDTKTHWVSESGLIDLFVFLGPTPKDVTKAYGELTGFTEMPQEFAIAYHQSRWNYNNDQDVKDVDRKMTKYGIPYDVIWLDIDFSDDKQYFYWEPLTFPKPLELLGHLDESQRKLVLINDPHIKKKDGYKVHEELIKHDFAVHDKSGAPFEGWCWPGSSHWIDCFNPAAITWWAGLFKFGGIYQTAANVFTWNDMNEPSVFNGPETTMPKDNLHHGGWEHRDIHNLNGMTFHNATYQALLERKKGVVRRPFVLTRAFFAGSQRLGAMWTGDNTASWDHLAVGTPMLLTQGIAGFPFSGADVGGFFGNPDKDLLTRWYQAGTFYPFFRGHAHIDTRRREPYLLEEPYRSIITQALRLRYALLPTWYTAFHEASVDGSPIVRPQYYVHPGDEAGFAIDDQFYIGSTGLLAKPVVTKDATSVDMYIADDEIYYDYFDYSIIQGKGKTTIDAPLSKIPLLMQGGHIIPRKDRLRRSSGLMKWDPYTLVVTLNKAGTAYGELYVDDGETFDYQSGAYIKRAFTYADGILESKDISIKGKLTDKYVKAMKKVGIEKIIVIGAPKEWEGMQSVMFGTAIHRAEYHAGRNGKAAWAVVKAPKASIGEDFRIKF